MRRLALKIISDRSSYFRWVLFGHAEGLAEFKHSEAPCEFHTFDEAMAEGLQALAIAEEKNDPQPKTGIA